MCLKYCKNYEDAEDVLQDSFITVFKRIEQYQHKGSFEGWIKRIAINTAIQKYRDNHFLEVTKVEVQPDENEEELDLNTTEVSIDFLLALIQQLPNKYRLVFNLYVLDNYSHKEIAELLHISIGTSKSNLSRAKQILKKELNKHQQKETM